MPIRILYLEDNRMDRELVREALASGDFDLREVRSLEELKGALASGEFDLVLTDFHVLGFEGLDILHFIQSLAPGVPVVVLTGTGSEELAVEALKEGAMDYVVKSPKHIRRLPQTILSALERARLRTEQEEAERALRAKEELLRAIIDTVAAGVVIYRGDYHLYVNRALERLTGYSREELLRMPFWELVHPEDRALVRDTARRRQAGQEVPSRYEYRVICKDGEVKWVEFNAGRIRWDGEEAFLGTLYDITAQKAAQREREELFQKLKGTFLQVVEALSRAMEYRDPYTSGHQRRVAELAEAMAELMGFDGHRREGIRVAGLLHDLGKCLAVPSEILNKPSKLNDVEFAIIKTHPEVGYRILCQVDFPWPVAEAVYQHHERLDGSGYPRGLKGDEIIPEARILAVADVVEAMTSHRPYRPALGLERALGEIRRGKGTLFDPEAVDACLEAFEGGFAFEGT